MQTLIFFTKKYALPTSNFLFLKRIEEKQCLATFKGYYRKQWCVFSQEALLYLLLTGVSYVQCGVLYVMY